jgi:hypothetical protein
MKKCILISAFAFLSFAFFLASCTKKSTVSTAETVGITSFSVGDTANFQGTAIWIYGTHNGVPFTDNIAPNVIADQSFVFPQDLTLAEFNGLEVSVLRASANESVSFALGVSYTQEGKQIFPLRYMNVQYQTDGAGYINGSYNPSDTVNLKEYAIYTLP